MTEKDLAGYVVHGEFNGTNWRPEIDYAFLHWNRNISNNVGYFGISWSYSPGDTCLSVGYPDDKEDGEYLYKSTSTITSINNCVIAIGITSATTGEHSMRSVQLDNGITTWLNQNGYFD